MTTKYPNISLAVLRLLKPTFLSADFGLGKQQDGIDFYKWKKELACGNESASLTDSLKDAGFPLGEELVLPQSFG